MPASKKLTSRKTISYLVIVALFVLADFHPAFFLAGAATAVLGEMVRLWATGHLEKNRKLTCSGPYAHVKNPLYLGTLLIMVGFCLAGSSTSAKGLGVLLVLLPLGLAVYYGYYFPYKKEVEGDRLVRRFGEQAERYLDEVPNLLPRLKPFSGTTRERWRFALVFENNEHLTLLAVVIGFALLWARTRVLPPLL
jgi:protein-S-isoprenylcysteine O-methyltransferase Ste14